MKTHSLFILTKTGICIYHKNFSNSDIIKALEINLITPFFSAILTFSEQVVFKNLDVLEMDDLRFVFLKDKGLVFVILADSEENLLFINSRLDKIKNLFYRRFKTFKDEGIALESDELIRDNVFDNMVKMVIFGQEEIGKFRATGSYENILSYFNDLISQHEIIGCALLTTKGIVIHSSLTDDLLNRAMKELEIRYMSGIFDLPELFYTLPNGQKVMEKIISYQNFIHLLLIIQFDETTSLGMMDLKAEMIISKIKSYF